MKKILCFLMVAVLTLGCLSGCGSATKSPDGTSKQVDGTSKQADGTSKEVGNTAKDTKQEIVELTGWGAWDFNPESTVNSYNEQLLWKHVEEKLGVKINWTNVSAKERASLFAIAMSDPDNIPDFVTEATPLEAEQYGRKGAFIDLSPYINEEYMPNLCKLMEEYPDVRASITSADDKIFFFPRIMALETRYWSGYFIREDMLETAGVEMPTTTDELYTVLKTIKEKVDTVDYPMYFNKGSLKSMLSFWNVGGRGTGTAENDDVVVVDGELVFSPMSDNYREALIYFNKLYADGLLNPDWNSGLDVRSAIVSKQTAMAEGSFSGVLTNYNALLVADGQGEVLTYMKPLTGPQGTTTRQGHHMSIDLGWCSAISSTCENPEALVKVIDYLYSDEGREHVYWGIEGETYTKDSNGNHTFTEKVASSSMGILNYLNSYSGNTSCYTSAMLTDFYQATLSDLAKEGNNEMTAIAEKNDIRLPALRYTDEEIKEIKLIQADLNVYVDEFFATAVNGIVDINDDAVWNKYLDGFKNLRVDEMMGYIETAYARYQKNIK